MQSHLPGFAPGRDSEALGPPAQRRPRSHVRRACVLALFGLAATTTVALPLTVAQAAPVVPGSVVAFGDNESGQLGTGTTSDSAVPVPVADLAGAKAISAGALHNLAITANGTVVTWGANFAGQLGDGTSTNRAKPVPVAGLSNVVAVSGGDAHSLALKADGSVFAWGANNFGQLGDGTTHESATPVAVTGLSKVVAIAAGSAHSLAVTADGSVFAWGDDTQGQVGNGKVTKDPNPTPTVVTGLPSAAASVAGGLAASFAVLRDGHVWAFGSDRFGQLGDGGETPRVNPPAVPYGCTCAVHPLQVMASNLPAPTARAQFNNPDPVTRRARRCSAVPGSCVPLSGITAISAGKGSAGESLAIGAGGTVFSWGGNFEGQLGVNIDGGSSSRALKACATAATPAVGGLPAGCATFVSGATSVAAGGGHNLIAANGSVIASGRAYVGQLGNGVIGAHKFSIAPVKVSGPIGSVSVVAAGGAHSLALQTGGALAPAPQAGAAAATLRPISRDEAVPAAEDAGPANVLASTDKAGAVSRFAPIVAQDPTRPGHVAMAYADDQGFDGPGHDVCRLAQSTDGGKTWTSRVLVGPGGDLALPPSASVATAPFASCGISNFLNSISPSYALAFGPDGALHYAFSASEDCTFGGHTFNNCGNNDRVFLTTSANGGTTFAKPVQVDTAAIGPNDPFGGDQDSVTDVAVDQNTGETYVSWVVDNRVNIPYTPIKVAKCTATACGPAVTASGDKAIDGSFHAQLAVAADGRVSLAWTDETEMFATDGNVFFNVGTTGPVFAKVATSVDHGKTFGAPVVADRVFQVCPVFRCATGAETSTSPDNFDNPFYDVSIAARPASGPGAASEEATPIVVATTGVRFGDDGRARVGLATSNNGGASFGAARQVGVIAGLESHRQHDAGVAVSAGGKVAVAFYDRAPNGDQHVYLMSGDGGLGRPVKVTTVSSREVVVNGAMGTDDLTRLSVIAGDDGAGVAWIDGRNATPGCDPNATACRTDAFFASTVEGHGGPDSSATGDAPGATPSVGSSSIQRTDDQKENREGGDAVDG